MILDSVLEFSDAQALASLDTTAVPATNVIDLGAATTGKDAFGNNEAQNLMDITWFANINTAMVGAGKILYCDLVTGSAVSSGAISSAVNIARIEFPAASSAGTKRSVKVQTGKLGRYLGVNYTATATLTSAKVDSGLVLGHNDSPVSEKFQG